MGQLKLEFLGLFRAARDGAQITSFESNKVRALLAYLVVEAQRPHRRESLAALLWPDWPDRAALSNLRYALSDLRKVIGDREVEPPFLLISREVIQFNAQSEHWLDAAEFARLAANAAPGDERAAEQLEMAVGLYQGEFLEGFTASEAAPFEDWARLKREQLHRLYLEALHSLAGMLERAGAYERGLIYARRQVEAEAWNEAAQRQLMRLLALSGRRGEALAQYEMCQAALKKDLGAAPAEETEALYQLLLSGAALPAAAAPVEAGRMPRAVGACPYRGLAVFREQDAKFFFGREQFARRLEEAVRRQTLMAVIVGSSGSGKSSVVYAGLLPKLREQGGWRITSFRPGERPFRALAGTLLPLLEPETSETDRLIQAGKLETAFSQGDVSLAEVVARAGQMGGFARHLLVVDQFEELYTLCLDPDERRRFLDQLLGIVAGEETQPDDRSALLLTLRADFMGQALAYRPFADALQQGSLLLGPMTREELQAAVEKPAELQGAAFEAGLVDRLLDDVGSEPGSLPLLEFALTLLWEKQDQGWLTHAVYDSIGLIDGALASFADQVYIGLEPNERERTRRILLQLVKPGEGTEDTRRVATKDELGDENWVLIKRLADRRLVVTGRDAAGNETAEVVHEALIQKWGRFREWIEADRAFRSWQERLRENLRQWQESGQEAGALLSGARLVTAQEWLVERGEEQSQAERAYIEASQAEQKVQREAEVFRQAREAALERRARRFLSALVVILLVAVLVASGLAYLARQAQGEAERQSQGRATQQAQAEQHAAARGTQQAIAEAEKANAQAESISRATAQADAVQQADLARARELSLAAINNLEVDPELSILLALQAVSAVKTAGKTIPIEIQDALHRAVLASRLRLTLRGHTSDVWTVAYKPDGSQLATASLDGTAKIWDVETGKEMFTLEGHQKGLRDVAYSFDGLRIATADDAGGVILWNPSTGELLKKLVGHSAAVWRLAFSPDSRLLATASMDQTARVWDARTGILLATLRGKEADTPFVSFNPDGTRLLSGFEIGESITLWDTKTWVETLVLRGTAAAFGPDGRSLAIGGADGSLRLVDADTGEQQLALIGSFSTALSGIAFSPDGSRLLGSDWENAVVWDTNSGQPLVQISGFLGIKTAFTPDGSRLIMSSQEGIVKVWDVESGEELFALAGSQPIYNLAINPRCDSKLTWCGTHLATATRDFTARVWDISPAGSSEVLVVPGFAPKFIDDGMQITIGGLADGNDMIYRTWDLSAGRLGTVVSSATVSLEAAVVNGDFSPEGARAAILTWDLVFSVFDLVQGEKIYSFSIEPDSQTKFAFNYEGTRLATAISNTVQIWDASTGQRLPDFIKFPRDISDFTFSPGGEYLAVAEGEDFPQIHLLETNNFHEISNWPAHLSRIEDLTFNSDGTRLVSGSFDATAKIWQVPSGKELLSLGEHAATVIESVFNQDGSQLATCSYDGTTRVWDASSGQNLFTFSDNGIFVTFSPDGKYLASGDYWGGLVHVYALDLEQLTGLAKARLTRTLTKEECRQYLHLEQCPQAP